MNKILTFVLVFAFIGCSTSKKIPQETIYEEQVKLLDTLVVSAPRPEEKEYSTEVYRAAANIEFDIKHMNLEVSFDWENEWVYGNAEIFVSPHFYDINTIQLDAVQMDILSIYDNEDHILSYDYDGKNLIIELKKEYARNETFSVRIKYIAKPSLGRINNGAYMAPDQGLYFINSDGANPEKPQQIWTQGETEYNSHWFPTRDKPNERFTHSIKITVDDQYSTLSNGIMTSSQKNRDRTRTDLWEMSDPHPPYLITLVVGQFAVIEEEWKDVPLQYYVEEDYSAYAKNIFQHTPEMMDFFKSITGVEYPWEKYAQVVVRDFVAGAMENTTASTFGEFVQKTDRELVDNHNDGIVAHELFHHWFGDYVTCESWANLTLNEGFANYSEYLWIAHKYGKDEADNKLMDELNGYLYQAKNAGVHPLIHYSYRDKEDMFDAHSYNKGGLILHLLRNEIGDKAFFEGMNFYLKENANSAVEVDELRMAYEEVTGRDLQLFFDQWYLSSGHPILEIKYDWTQDDIQIRIDQIQNGKDSRPIFQIPISFDVYLKNGEKLRKKYFLEERSQIINLKDVNTSTVSWINFDPDHVLVGEYSENRNIDSYILEYKQSTSQYDKREALNALRGELVERVFYEDIFHSNDHYINRWIASNRLDMSTIPHQDLLAAIDRSENSYYKGKLLSLFLQFPTEIEEKRIIQLLENERSWTVIAPALQILNAQHSTLINKYIDRFSTEKNSTIRETICFIHTERKNWDAIDYLWESLLYINMYRMKNVVTALNEMIKQGTNEQIKTMVESAINLTLNSTEFSIERKKAIANLLVTIKSDLNENQLMEFNQTMNSTEIKDKEIRDILVKN